MQNNYKRVAENISELLDRVQSTGKREAVIVVEAAQFLQAIIEEKLIVSLAPQPQEGGEDK